jgi:hypothetical protein
MKYVKKLSFIILLFLSIANFVHAQQVVKVKITLETEEAIKQPEGVVQRILLEREQKTTFAYLHVKDKKLLLILPDTPQLELPKRLPTLVSLDGSAILQFGDEIQKMHPQQTNLFWLSQEGEVIEQVVDYFAGDTMISMSVDGFTAVAGKGIKDEAGVLFELYSPAGKKTWGVILAENQRVDSVVVSPEGKYATANITDSKAPLKDQKVEIRDEEGSIIATNTEIGIIHKIVLLESGDKAFVQGLKAYGLLKIPNGEFVWRRSGKVRLISPYGASLSPDGQILFLLMADFKGKSEPEYRWLLLALNASDGTTILEVTLPSKYSSTWDRVFEHVSSNEIKILAGDKRITYSWSKNDGGGQ